jgi:hypothetical protein
MKKVNTFIIALLIIFLTGSSCQKWLKEENFTKISSDVIYKDEAGLEVGLGGLYNLQRSYERTTDNNSNGLTQNNLWLYCADDLGCTRTFNDAQIYKASMTPTGFPRGKWSAGYQLIDRASAVISAAPAVSFSNPTRKNQLIAEAKVIRAYTYFKLWQLYDNILIDTIPTTAENAFDPVVYKPASKTDVLNLINSDLDFAITNLSYLAKPGQVNQGFARHLRAQVAAWQNDWATMAAQVDSIVASGKYSLQPIEKVFGQDVNHSEAIFTYQLDELLGGSEALSGGGSTILGGVFQARYYEMPGGHIIEDNNYGGNSLGWTVPNNYLRSLYNPDPITGVSADKRFTNYYYPDSLIGNKPGDPYYGKPLPKSSYPDNYRQYHWSVMKYKDIAKPAGTYQSYKDIIVCRYAETLLLGAEAHWRLTNNPSDPTALKYINMVRARAGVPPFTAIDQQTILDESARELAFEGGRWFLLKRMGVLVSQVNAHHTFGSAKTNETVYPMQPWMVRWPIPQDQIDLMAPNFPQNPGY